MIDLKEEEEDYPEVHSDSDEEVEDPKCPYIRVSTVEKHRLYQKWHHALIIKVLGKMIPYLEVEWYDNQMLMSIGNKLERAIRVDHATISGE
ncbi:hypothetical protein Tsubulata_011281 [Turnera subulata]|uniref:Uncharacterized protein n=1 Tax=Turnera subulata TaxID=218843 RepID=A0A9Q0G507_9ROSI|nr:hypothetical protein Tsubulata_011281 [Turnera subulata]